MAPDGRALLLLGAAGAALAGGCRREAFHGPLALLERPTVEGRLARSHRLALGGAERSTLVETAAYRVLLPRRALLTFGVAVTPIGSPPAKGAFRLSVRAAGRPVWRRSFPASGTFGFEDFGIAFDGASRVGTLELELRPQDGAGGMRCWA